VALSILMPGRNGLEVAHQLRAVDPKIDARVWPDDGDRGDVSMVISWNHPPGALLHYPRLEVVASYGAGIDHLLQDDRFPAGVRVVRMIDEDLAQDMAEYVLAALLAHFRNFQAYLRSQRWAPIEYSRRRSVLVLGLGRLGGTAARRLRDNGIDVSGWSRTPAKLEGIRCLCGRQALDSELSQVDAVVCMLPLTPETRGLLDASFFAHMRHDSLLVNVGRGAHVVEADLLQALRTGRPGAAWLDVFDPEPLTDTHPFWSHPAITITPHVASLTNPESVAEQIVENYRRLQKGALLLNLADLARGY